MPKVTPLKVDPIIDMLYTNNSIDQARYPIFQNRRRVKLNARDIQFFLDSDYDFKNQIWKSGFFKIQENEWAILSDVDEYKYPILGNGSTSTCETTMMNQNL